VFSASRTFYYPGPPFAKYIRRLAYAAGNCIRDYSVEGFIDFANSA
jgi:hypothetical protein